MVEAQSILVQSASLSSPKKPSKDASKSNEESSFSQGIGLQWLRMRRVRLLSAGWQNSDGTASASSFPYYPPANLSVLLGFLSELVPLGLPRSLL